MNQTQPTPRQDEITLKELIQILLDYKLLIAAITITVTLLAGIYSFVIAEPNYEAKAVLNASPIGTDTVANGNIESIVNDTGLFPVSTVETYMEQLVSPQLLKKVIENQDLRNEEGKYITVGALQGMLDIQNVENTNLLEITVTTNDPEKSELIANEVANDFIRFIDDAGKEQSTATATKIESQLVIEEANLAEKSQNLADFMSESINISELRSDIGSLVSQITSIKSTLNSLEISITTAEKKMATLKPHLKSTDYVIDSLELNTSGGLVGEGIEVTTIDDSDLSASLIAIDFVNTQNAYISNKAKYDAYTVQLAELETEVVEKQALLVEEEYKYDRLNREVQLATQTYNAYQVRYQEAIVAAAAEIGSNNIVISSEAVLPEAPTSPNKTLNLAIGIVLGGMIGVFTAFFRAYWKNA